MVNWFDRVCASLEGNLQRSAESQEILQREIRVQGRINIVVCTAGGLDQAGAGAAAGTTADAITRLSGARCRFHVDAS
ncbi:hypothetical protein NKJ06_07875 [Mesorhizobium sp. M0293]|uniref:hypothetical protein n=1 Tax=unclassified Mesorhizobium TaxID=325217 RepID=UPI00333BD4A7